jgi:pyridinium-3,5-bisthiocarboxylic acid mononucleotide nickel chelatase
VSRVLYVDVVGGAAGDMLLAALMDAGVPPQPVAEAVERVLPGRFTFQTEQVTRAGVRAAKLRIEPGPAAHSTATGPTHRSNFELLEVIERAGLSPRISAAARAVLERLGQAEARVHGSTPGQTELHELGDDDTLLDVVGLAAALEAAEIDRVLVSAIPLEEQGWIPPSGNHPGIPLPAPVTLELLRGFRTRGGGRGEVVTPTAAAIFAALASPADGFPSLTIEAVGYGAGTADPPDRPNLVRVVLGSDVPDVESEPDGGPGNRDLVVMEANLDDLTPELVADAVQALLSAGAQDAWTTPAQMKKGRPGVILSALAEPAVEHRLRAVFFEATSTFGVRSYPVRRAELERRILSVDLPDGSVRVKVGLLAGRVVSATPEHDDVAAVAARVGRSVRHVYEEAAAAARALLLSSSR